MLKYERMNNMKKRLVSTLLVAMMVLSLAACGDKNVDGRPPRGGVD